MDHEAVFGGVGLLETENQLRSASTRGRLHCISSHGPSVLVALDTSLSFSWPNELFSLSSECNKNYTHTCTHA